MTNIFLKRHIFLAQISLGLGSFLATHAPLIQHLVALAHVHALRGQPELATHGALSVAVPGEVAGYWAAKQRFGNPALAWAELVRPAIELCNNGGWSQAGHESGEYCRN